MKYPSYRIPERAFVMIVLGGKRTLVSPLFISPQGNHFVGKTCEEDRIPLRRRKDERNKALFIVVNLLASLNFVFFPFGSSFLRVQGHI
jgi:hypothetical protein